MFDWIVIVYWHRIALVQLWRICLSCSASCWLRMLNTMNTAGLNCPSIAYLPYIVHIRWSNYLYTNKSVVIPVRSVRQWFLICHQLHSATSSHWKPENIQELRPLWVLIGGARSVLVIWLDILVCVSAWWLKEAWRNGKVGRRAAPAADVASIWATVLNNLRLIIACKGV